MTTLASNHARLGLLLLLVVVMVVVGHRLGILLDMLKDLLDEIRVQICLERWNGRRGWGGLAS